MVYVHGDLHGTIYEGQFEWLPSGSVVIIAGDAGLEYGRFIADNVKETMRFLSNITWYILRGNHDNRYWRRHRNDSGWTVEGNYLIEDRYQNVLYLRDEGGVYDIQGQKFLMIPGAYSVDKMFRLMYRYPYEKREQLTIQEMDDILELTERDKEYDFVISHTYPIGLHGKLREFFLDGLSDSEVDATMEKFLQAVDDNVTYKKWFFGHMHGDKVLDDKHILLFHDMYRIGDAGEVEKVK